MHLEIHWGSKVKLLSDLNRAQFCLVTRNKHNTMNKRLISSTRGEDGPRGRLWSLSAATEFPLPVRRSVHIKSLDFVTHWPWFRYWLCCLLAVWSWTNDSVSLCLFWKMRIRTAPTSSGCCEPFICIASRARLGMSWALGMCPLKYHQTSFKGVVTGC